MFGRHAEIARRIGGEVDDQLGAGQLRDQGDGVAGHLLGVAAGLDDLGHVPMELPQVERLGGRICARPGRRR